MLPSLLLRVQSRYEVFENTLRNLILSLHDYCENVCVCLCMHTWACSVYAYVQTHTHTHKLHGTCMEVRGQLCGVSSPFPPLWLFWWLNSGCPACTASAFTYWDKFHEPPLGDFNRKKSCQLEQEKQCRTPSSNYLCCNWVTMTTEFLHREEICFLLHFIL